MKLRFDKGYLPPALDAADLPKPPAPRVPDTGQDNISYDDILYPVEPPILDELDLF